MHHVVKYFKSSIRKIGYCDQSAYQPPPLKFGLGKFRQWIGFNNITTSLDFLLQSRGFSKIEHKYSSCEIRRKHNTQKSVPKLGTKYENKGYPFETSINNLLGSSHKGQNLRNKVNTS